jgi:transposase
MMARTPSRFVAPLTAEDQEVLRYLRDQGETGRIRKRAHAILLSAAGQSVNELARTFEVTRNTVRDWLRRWEQEGVSGLADAARRGRPPILTAEEQTRAVELLRKEPRSTKFVLQELATTTGKTISAVTLRRIARRKRLRWKRMRRSAKDRRDPVKFARAQEELADLQAAHGAGELDLQYFDEAGFSLQPSIPYAWQPEGETIEIPSRRSRQLNVLGFLSLAGLLTPFITEGTIDTEVVISCFEAFSKQIRRATVVVIDNASAHTSKRFQECCARWEERGLFLYYLPPHCPELNLIEILWRMIKYRWLPLSAYQDFPSLLEKVQEVLVHVGSRYTIDFAAAKA